MSITATKQKALHSFFSSFGITAYSAASVPSDAAIPYLTYEGASGAWVDGDVPITVNLWYYTENEALINAKAEEIARAVTLGGVMLKCDGGGIWLKRGSPFCQSLYDGNDKNVRRRYINLSAEFVSNF